MFYSTDLLLRKDARFSLIWRLAVTNGHAGGTKKRQILSVNINSIVAELLQRIPTQPLTADQQKNCFSLRLISQLLYGTCIVFQYQISNLQVDAKHVWDSCRHIRFDEKEKFTKRRKKERDEIDWDQIPPGDEPMSKRRKRRSDFDLDRTEIHESQVVMGMDFLDRALINSRTAYDITNITLPDDTMFIGGMNDPMFIQPDQDLIPTTDAMMDAFLNGEDMTFTTKEASENRSSQEHLKDISQFDPAKQVKKRREERAASEAIERHRASSHVSHFSMERSGAMPLMDDMMMIDDLNLSSSMAGIEGDTRTSVPAHFVSAGPIAISTQVNPELEPILPSELSQILPIDNANITMDARLEDFFMDGIPSERRIASQKDDEDEEAKRASAGSGESRNNIMNDLMMDGEMEVRTREKRRDGPKERIEETPKVKRRKEERDDSEENDVKDIRPKREPQSTKLDGNFMKDSMADYSDTLVGKNARRVKIDEKKKKKATELFKTVPTLMGTHLAKNRTLNTLFKLLKVDKINLHDDIDLFDEEEERLLEPWQEIEKERQQLERMEDEEEEEEEEEENAAKRRKDESMVEDMNQTMQQTRMDDMTMMDNVTMERIEGEHMTLATIEGDWEERNEYIDQLVETRFEEKDLSDEEKRRLREQREREEEEDEVEEARRRRTTGNFSDGMRMGDQMDLMDQFPPLMLDESRRSEERMMEERELRDGEGLEMVEKLEWRMETEARVNKEKRKTMAQVENHEAIDIILSACREAMDKRVTLSECIPVGANKATAARMFYNLLVLTKQERVVPDQTEAYGPIQIGLSPDYQFPVYEEVY